MGDGTKKRDRRLDARTLKFDSCRLRFINFLPSFICICCCCCCSCLLFAFLCVCNVYTYGYFHTFTVVFLLVKLISPKEICLMLFTSIFFTQGVCMPIFNIYSPLVRSGAVAIVLIIFI